jgi:hypothetical protein
MSLYEKIISVYSTLTEQDFNPFTGTIRLQNDSDGNGDYIAQWNHPTLPKPTEEQLNG